jgi:ABC-type multidrug transport system fused ATPase/permease subunit
VRSQLDAIFGQLKQKFDGALVVKAHACEEDEITRFSAQIAAAHETRLRLERMNSAFSSVNLLLSGVGSSLVFAVAAWEASWGRMTPGEVVLMASMAVLVFAPVARLADLASVYEQARASMNRLNEIIDQAPAIPDLARPLPLLSATGLVEFKEVGFHYEEGQPVLADISFRIEPGMKVAIVGPTGSGKTTLMNLLMRFYDPTSGAIRLDGEALDRLAVGDLRKQIGIVAQEPVIFRQSLADNIRYGAGNVSQTVVEAAARAALVDEIAAGLPNGYQTLIGEGGYKLSQGERQRIAIARALCKNPALVVLDEATSSLDAPSEALIQAALANLLRGRTAFIIAHRLATVADADLIVVLDQGRVVQVGKHTDLLAQPDGLYGQLLRGQFGDAPTAA